MIVRESRLSPEYTTCPLTSLARGGDGSGESQCHTHPIIIYSPYSPVKLSMTGVLKLPGCPVHKAALTITEQLCPAAVQSEHTPDMLELTEQEPPQSETTSYEEVPQSLVGFSQVKVNVDKPMSVTTRLVGGGGGSVGVCVYRKLGN